MNFKFLFKNNINDNRLMQQTPAPETGLLGINWQDKNALFNYWQNQRKFQTPTINVGNVPSETTGTDETDGAQESSTIKFNGIDTGYVYDDNLSARKNRKLLKQTLKAKGIGDKADATGLISEYLTSNGGARGKDAAWLAKKSKQYGYTTDANGNRDYHRNPSNAGKIFATIGGALLGGPLGAFGGYMLANQNSQIPGLKKGFFDPTSVVKPNPAENPVENPVAENPVENPVQPTSYTFSGFTGPWGSHIESVYNDHQQSDHWGNMDTDHNGNITQSEFSAYQGQLGEVADGKLGRNTLAALGLQGNYSWMNPGGNGGNSGGGKYTPGSDEMWVDDARAFGFKGDVNGKQDNGGYVNRAEWEKARTNWYNDWESNVSDEQKAKWDAKFGKGNYDVTYDPNKKMYFTKVKNLAQHPANIAKWDAEFGKNNWTANSDGTMAGRNTITYNDTHGYANGKLIKNLNVNGEVLPVSMWKGKISAKDSKGMRYVVIPETGQVGQVQNGGYTTPFEGAYYSYKQGGMLKFQQGGQLDDQDKILLASTLGMIGYAASQGKQMQIEEAAAQVASLAQSQPESLQELASNKELVNAGIQIVGQETVQKLSQPGVMKQLLSNIVNKMPKAMKGTKLNYIKELKGICPEGYEMQYFAKGGHLCPVCKPKKVEEAKCGKKMKAKKHEGGGGVSTTVNDIKNQMKNNQQTPQKQTSKKQAPKKMVYNQKDHDRLIKEFQTNPKGKFSYKGWPKAKQDSLTWFNANDPREDGV